MVSQEIFDFHFSKFEMTPLMLTCAVGSINVCKILFQSSMREKLNDVDSQGFNCLYYATYHGHLEIVKLLKKMKIQYAKDSKDTSCLHIAVMRGHSHVAEFLLRKTSKKALAEARNPEFSEEK